MNDRYLDDEQLRVELFQFEEADAWFEYKDSTQYLHGSDYDEKETWAWALLRKRLREVSARRQI